MTSLFRVCYRLLAWLQPDRFPFRLPPAEREGEIRVKPLRELIAEPTGILKGHTITFWFYHNGENITEVLEAGHSNAAICGRVSSLVHHTVAELTRVDIRLYTAGALWLRVDGSQSQDQERVRALMRQLTELEEQTGLVRVVRASSTAVERFRNEQQRHHEQAKTASNLTSHGQLQEGAAPSLVFDYVPFPARRSGTTLSFALHRRIYEAEGFDVLSRLHEASFRVIRLRETLVRTETYMGWLLNDLEELRSLHRKKEILSPRLWAAKLIPYSGTRDYYLASSTPSEEGLDIEFRRIQELFAYWDHNLLLLPCPEPRGTESLLAAVAVWKENVAHLEGKLEYGTTSHAQRLEHTAPAFILEDLRWLMQMLRILILESDDENSAIRCVQSLLLSIMNRPSITPPIHEFLREAMRAGVLEELWQRIRKMAEWILAETRDLPPRLTEGVNEILSNIDDIGEDVAVRRQREALSRSVSEGILLDAVLRGWPPIFLTSHELRQRYHRWAQVVRPRIWREIWLQLRAQRILMAPLVEDNVTFGIVREGKITKITPYAGVDSERYLSLSHPRLGTVHYVAPWSYRRIMTANVSGTREMRLASLVTGCWRALAEDNLEAAIHQLRAALDVHPLEAWARFREELWGQLGEVKDPNEEPAQKLQLGLRLIGERHGFSRGRTLLEEFIFRYPDRLADPHLFLAAGGALQQLAELRDRQQEILQKHRNYMKQLDEITRGNTIAMEVARLGLAEDIEYVGSHLFSGVLPDLAGAWKGRSAPEILADAEQEILRHIDSIYGHGSMVTSQGSLLILAGVFKMAMDRDQDEFRRQVEDLNRKVASMQERLWSELPLQDGYVRAYGIDPAYVERILQQKRLFWSPRLQLEYEPFFDMADANQKLFFALRLQAWSTESREAAREGRKPISGSLEALLMDLLKEPTSLSQSSRERLEGLLESKVRDLRQRPEQEDSFVRLDLIAETENLASIFLPEVLRMYHSVGAMLPSYLPPQMHALEIRGTMLVRYMEALRLLVERQVTVRSALGGGIEIEYDTEVFGHFQPRSLRVESKQRIVAYGDDGKILCRIAFEESKPSRLMHIQECVEREEFSQRLHPLSRTLAGRILKTPIPPPPSTRRILEVVRRLQADIVHLLAYLGARIAPPLSDCSMALPADLRRLVCDSALGSCEQQDRVRLYLRMLADAEPVTAIVCPRGEALLRSIAERHGYSTWVRSGSALLK